MALSTTYRPKITLQLMGVFLCIGMTGMVFGQKTTKAKMAADSSYIHDFAPDFADSTIANRFKSIKTDMPLVFNDKVRSFVDYFSLKDRDYTRRMLQRERAFFPIFEFYLEKHGLPKDLKYLTIVESGLNPKIESRAGALGLWQFMPSTGKMFKLDYDHYVDERMDIHKSTEAACKYLKQLYKMFNDWELALAAYNCGPGNVRRAIRNSGYKDSFWTVYNQLPKETRGYVPQFHAIQYIMRYAHEHNLYPDKEERFAEYVPVTVNQYVNIEAFANKLKICPDELLKLNPEIKRGIVPGHLKPYELRIPSHVAHLVEQDKSIIAESNVRGKEELNVRKVTDEKASSAANAAPKKSKIVHTIKRGEGLGKIATKYGVTVADLKEWNNISNPNNVRVGQKVVVYKGKEYFEHTKPAPKTQVAQKESKTESSKESKDKEYYVVQNGDTLWSISQKYTGLTVEQLKKLNKLTNNKLTPGQRLRVS